MTRLDPRIERRLDNYAILYCFNRPGEASKKALDFVGRIQGFSKKMKYTSLKYYRGQITSCEIVKKSLEDFAKSYVDMNPEERAGHDEMAMSFITTVFSEDTENVFYLIDYYNQKKSELLR